MDIYGNFAIVNRDAIPKKISHIMYDADGTLLDRSQIEQPMIEKMLGISRAGVHQTVITGRDAPWIFKMFDFLKQGNNRLLLDRFSFIAEYGLIECDLSTNKTHVVSDVGTNHPILDPEIRKGVAGLVWQPARLRKYLPGIIDLVDSYIGADSESNCYFIPKSKLVSAPHHMWHPAKEVMMTVTMIRDGIGRLMPEAIDNHLSAAAKITEFLEQKGVAQEIKVIAASSAIDLVPIVKTRAGMTMPFDKDLAAGNAIWSLAEKKGINALELCQETIGIGDSGTDILFSVPIIGPMCCDVAMFFVGAKKNFTPQTDQEKKNIAGVSLHVLDKGLEYGSEVTMAILDWLDNRF